MTDKLVLLDAGEAALNNPSAGGILVNPSSFKFGDSSLYPSTTTHTDIVGAFVASGTFHHVEALSAKAMRFVMDIDTRTLLEPKVIKEVVIFLEGNIALARAVFAQPYTLNPGEPTRLSAILATSRADLTTINVSIGDYDSIPQTPFMYRLPNPNNSEFNVISVLNGKRNPDGTNSPVLAMRYGAGAFQWGFTDHMRVFNGIPTSATDSSFKIPDMSGYAANEQVIVHVVSGSGEGQSRRYRYNAGAGEFRDADSQPISNLAACTISVWKMQAGGSGGGNSEIPPTTDIPRDWVLTPGIDGNLTWEPPKAASRIVSTLYTPPSKLDVNALNYVGAGDESRYTTGDKILENSNYLYAALGTATQHRSSFSVRGSEVEFGENIDSSIPIDLRLFTKSPSTGTRIVVKLWEFEGDGAKTEFDLAGADIESIAHIFAFVSCLLLPSTSYTYDVSTKKLRFTSPPDAGLPIEIRAITYVQETGYSTRIVSKTYRPTGDTFFLTLPTTPQSPEQVFVAQAAAHIHQQNYTIVDNAVVFSNALHAGYDVEVWILENVQAAGTAENGLNGIVVDGYVGRSDIVLLRHGAAPIELPIPKPNLLVGKGMKLNEQDGALLLELDEDALSRTVGFQKWTQNQVEKDATTIIATQRIELTTAMIVMVTCDFSAKLGPGYASTEGGENVEYIIGVRSSQSKEPEFGQGTRGTGTTGLVVGAESKSTMAYANASLTQTFEFDPANHTSGYVDIVAKMRINNAETSQFATRLEINFNALELPK